MTAGKDDCCSTVVLDTLDGLMDSIDPNLKKEVSRAARETSMAREILTRRIKVGLTQADLARRLGWPRRRVSRFESSPNTLIRMEDYLKCVCATSKRGARLSPSGIEDIVSGADYKAIGSVVERMLLPPKRKRAPAGES